MAQSKTKTKTANEILGVILIALGLAAGICVYTNTSALVVKWVRAFVFGGLGIGGYIAPLGIIFGGVMTIVKRKQEKPVHKIILWVALILAALTFIQLCYSQAFSVKGGYGPYLERCFNLASEQPIGGGVFGGLLGYPATVFLGQAVGIVIFLAAMIAIIMYLTHFSITNAGRKIGEKLSAVNNNRMSAQAMRAHRNDQRAEKVYREAFTYESQPITELYEDEGGYEPLPQRNRRKRQRPEEGYYEDAALYEEQIPKGQPLERPKKRREKAEFSLFDVEPDNAADQQELDESLEFSLGRDTGRGSFLDEFTVEGDEEEAQVEEENLEEPVQTAAKSQAPLKAESRSPIIEEQRPIEPLPKEDYEPVEGYEYDSSQDTESVKAAKPKFTKPPVTLLNEPKAKSAKENMEEIRGKAALLEQTLKSFNISAKVTNVSVGPTVTRYELQPAPGVKISRIVNLSNDIALNLAAESLRMEAPIPGKAAIGIEIPNEHKATVSARELIDTEEFRKQKSNLAFALGKDIAGKNVYADLARMPHMLVSGTTGSGKSVCLNTIITSFLYNTTPEELQLIMVDPKQVEMAAYNDMPHMMIPVVTDPKKASGALAWAVTEMINRYKMFSLAGVKEIEKYNALALQDEKPIMPKIVIIIDEFADLMMTSSKEVEDAVCRIAQLGRASGIHLIIATQSPRADIFTGLIKSNVPSRIALKAANALESRITLDAPGAEKLIGYGDMLFYPTGASKAVRLQGCYIEDAERDRIVDFLKEQGTAQYDETVAQEIEKAASSDEGDGRGADDPGEGGDPMLPQALQVALDHEGVSTSMLQRRLRLGYAKAARIVDDMEERGWVGPANGSKPREVLITWEDYNKMFGPRDGI